MTTTQLAALKTELQNDPAALGYSALLAVGSDQGLADVLNFVRDGVTACPINGVVGAAIAVKRTDITSQELLEAIDVRDLPAAGAWQSWLESITQQSRIRFQKDDGTDTNVLGNLTNNSFGLFPNTVQNGTRLRIRALAVRAGSRAETLFGVNTSVTATDIAVSGIHG